MRKPLHVLLGPVCGCWPGRQRGSGAGAPPVDRLAAGSGMNLYMKYFTPPIAVPVLILIVVAALAVFRP
jgi:hypothetical protein